jgi:hypothetical protein
MASKRVVTSAIPNMTVGEVRRGLDMIRRRWRERTPEQPFYISDMLCHGYTMEEFAFRFVMGHHYKRHNKDGGSEDEDDEDEEEEGEEGARTKKPRVT